MKRAEAIQDAVKKHTFKHIGFKDAEKSAGKQDPKVVGAIIASASRKASTAFRSKNK